MGTRLVAWAVLGLALGSGAASHAAAQDGAALRWSPHYTRFTTAQYALSASMTGGLLASELVQGPESARWQSDILLDRQARSLLAAGPERDRMAADEVSDYLRTGLVLYPFVIDSLLVAGILQQSPDVAVQMGLISLQGMLVAKLVTGLTKDFVGRARPDVGDCVTGSELSCSQENESFISGHTSGAFAGAGLICAHHQHFRLYGSETAGTIACGSSLGLAATVGTLRIVAGRHHLTDVLAGALVGFGGGYLLANVTNYDFGDGGTSSTTLVPIVEPQTLGAQLVVTF